MDSDAPQIMIQITYQVVTNFNDELQLFFWKAGIIVALNRELSLLLIVSKVINIFEK